MLKQGLIIVIILILVKCGAFAQQPENRILLNKLLNEYDAGHYSVVDSILNDDATQVEIRAQKDPHFGAVLLQLKRDMALSDGNRIQEADSLQKILNGNIKTIYSFRIGPAASWDITNIGSTGWRTGLMIGVHSKKVNSALMPQILYDDSSPLGWGIDVFAGYQRQPFIFDDVENKDADNRYKEDGFVLNSKGHNDNFLCSIIGSLNFEPDYNGTRLGVGLIAGVEFTYIQQSIIKDHYYEYGYKYMSGNTNEVSYSSYEMHNIKEDHYFTSKQLINPIWGMNIYYQASKHIMLTFSPRGSLSVFKKLSVDNSEYSKRLNYVSLQLSCQYLFNH